jgi:integrase
LPNYKEKITEAINQPDFIETMQKGLFVQSPKHQGFTALIAYTGVRVSEALRLTRSQFRLTPEILFIDVGPRLKHSKTTQPLPIPLAAPYVNAIEDSLKDLKQKDRVWPYCRKTGYHIIRRAGFHYPHFLRLSRITNFLLAGYTIPDIQSWTGQSATTINAYVGMVNISKMGEGLKLDTSTPKTN